MSVKACKESVSKTVDCWILCMAQMIFIHLCHTCLKKYFVYMELENKGVYFLIVSFCPFAGIHLEKFI